MIYEINNTTNGKSIHFFEDENGIADTDEEFRIALLEWLDFFEGNKQWSEEISLDVEGTVVDQHYIETARDERRPGGESKLIINYSQETLVKVIESIAGFGLFVQEFSYGYNFQDVAELMNMFRLALEPLCEESQE